MSDTTYIREDQYGVKRVGETRVMLDSVVAAFHQGHSAESITQQYPSITLEEAYGAITFYLGNKVAVDEYLRCQDDVWKKEREKTNQNASPVVARLCIHTADERTDSQ